MSTRKKNRLDGFKIFPHVGLERRNYMNKSRIFLQFVIAGEEATQGFAQELRRVADSIEGVAQLVAATSATRLVR